MRSIIAWLALGLLATASACSGGDKDSFRNVDHDKNGKISYEELLFVFPEVTPELFSHFDTDGDGVLSENEYGLFLTAEVAKSTGAAKAPSPSPLRPGETKPMSVPFKGEEVIEIPAPLGDTTPKNRPEKSRKDQKGKTDAKAEPAPKGEATQYTVQRGDSLLRIGRKFGVTVEEITKANGDMNPDTLRDGQVLNIPARQ